MADNSTLKSSIRNVVKTNGDGAITGQNMQDVLISMVDVLGEGYQFLGGCTPSTNPGTPDNNVFYLATEAGTYSNFTGDSITEPTIFYFDTTWHALAVNGDFAAVVRVTDILNNFNRTASDKALSAGKGKQLNDTLNSAIAAIQEGYAFMGLAATTDTAPAISREYNLAYLATEAGTYTNLGNLTVADLQGGIPFPANLVQDPAYRFRDIVMAAAGFGQFLRIGIRISQDADQYI